MKIEFSQQIF